MGKRDLTGFILLFPLRAGKFIVSVNTERLEVRFMFRDDYKYSMWCPMCTAYSYSVRVLYVKKHEACAARPGAGTSRYRYGPRLTHSPARRHDAAPQLRAAGGRGADLRPRAVRAVAEDARAAHGPGRVRRAQGHRATQPRCVTPMLFVNLITDLTLYIITYSTILLFL